MPWRVWSVLRAWSVVSLLDLQLADSYIMSADTTDAQANHTLEMRPFARNRSFIGVNLRDFMRWPVASARATIDGLRDLLDKGVIKPVRPTDIFDIG